jgi:membrane-bound lytic murein transglycosylase D
MVRIRLAMPALSAFAAVAAAVLTAGCQFVPPVQTEDREVVETDTDFDVLGKVDEADIGTLGPVQIEEAIETLDAANESQPPLVRELSSAPVPTLPSPSDLFERIRDGFALSDVEHAHVEREVTWFARHPTYLDRTFKRGERYLYHIVKEIEARKMPLELALLPVVESAFNPVAYSRARAAGLWQFIPATGRRYGLKQNWYYDGRRDVVAATTAALDYLEFLHAEFNGDWLLAVAAYNTGEMNVARAIQRNRAAGKPTDFFSLKLPRETRAYVPKLLAMRRIVADPTSHGLAFAPIPNRSYFARIDVGGQIDLQVAAEMAGMPKEELLALNPAFNHWVTDPDGPHYLLVPAESEQSFSTAVVALPPDKRVRIVYHRVRSGDTLGGIASKYGVPVATLRTANKLRGNVIHPGQDLLITSAPQSSATLRAAMQASSNADRVERQPVADKDPGKHVVRSGETLWRIARLHGVSMERLASANSLGSDAKLSVGQVLEVPATATLASTSANAVSSQTMTYVVRAGDTLSRIATQFRVSLNDLLGWNDLESRSVIKPGQRLVMYVAERTTGI